MSKICVLGQVYNVPPDCSSVCKQRSRRVVGVDANKSIADTLRADKTLFQEKGFQELLDGDIAEKTYMTELLVKEAGVFLAAVPTTFDFEILRADLKYLVSAYEIIISYQ